MKKCITVLLFGMSLVTFGYADEMSPERIQSRTAPVGQVNTGKAADVKAPVLATKVSKRTGKEIYNKYCGVCHTAGIAGAPKMANKEQWTARQAKGFDALVDSAIKGINAMPAKGTCSDCSKDDIAEAVKYMLPAT